MGIPSLTKLHNTQKIRQVLQVIDVSRRRLGQLLQNMEDTVSNANRDAHDDRVRAEVL